MRNGSKLGALLLASALVLAFAGCSGSGSDTSSAPAADSSVVSTDTAVSAADESTADESAASTEDEKSDDAGTAGDSENVKDYLYFDNSETKWEKVCVYWWNDNYDLITNKLTGDPYPANTEDGKQDLGTSWPGVEMEKIGDSGIYRAVMPVGATKIIFNTGIKDEDVRNGVEAYQTDDMHFDEAANAGQVYKIDISQEAVKGRGVEKTKYRYPAGSWSDYTG